MLSKQILKNALQQFEGTVVLVSHDRDFLQDLTTKTFEFTREGIKEHLGHISDFLEKKQMEDMRMLAKRDEEKKADAKKPEPQRDSNNNDAARKDKEKEQKKLKQAIEQSEKRIAELERTLGDLDTKLQDPQQFATLSTQPDFYTRYDQLKKQLDEEMAQWEKHTEALQQLQ